MKIVTAMLLASALVVTGQAVAEQAGAATLQGLNGNVLVDKGAGLVPGKAGAALKDGDRIFTLEKSGAKIVFPDGNAVMLSKNSTFVVNAELGSKALPVASNPPPAALSGPTAGQESFIRLAQVGSGACTDNPDGGIPGPGHDRRRLCKPWKDGSPGYRPGDGTGNPDGGMPGAGHDRGRHCKEWKDDCPCSAY